MPNLTREGEPSAHHLIRRRHIARPFRERAIQKLKVLGSGFQLLTVGGRKAVQTVPMELNSDQTKVLSEASEVTSERWVPCLPAPIAYRFTGAQTYPESATNPCLSRDLGTLM